jgi:hypothetical protein
MILEELELPHQVNLLEFNETKDPRYLKLNPNGRLPTIEDPNTGITIWEVRTLQRSTFLLRKKFLTQSYSLERSSCI